MNKYSLYLFIALSFQSAIAANVAPMDAEYPRPGEVEFLTFANYQAKVASNVMKPPGSDFSELITRSIERSKKMASNGPGPNDWDSSTSDEKSKPTETCVRTSVMTKHGMLNLKECLDRVVLLDEAASWFEKNRPNLSGPIDFPGRFFIRYKNTEILSFFYRPSTKELNEIVVFSTAIK